MASKKEQEEYILSSQHGKELLKIYEYMKFSCYCPASKFYKHNKNLSVKIESGWEKNFFKFYEWADKSGFKLGMELTRKSLHEGYIKSNCEWVGINEFRKRNDELSLLIVENNKL